MMGAMTLQNRVTPLSELIADPARGLVYGNRGCLHDGTGRIRRRYAGKRWIACRLRFRGWHRSPLLQPGRFTELFFLDEATAFAAGHRPCALCRREDYVRFGSCSPARRARTRWTPSSTRSGSPTARSVIHDAALDELPDGAFVLRDGGPWLVRGDALLRWTPDGYAERAPRPGSARALLVAPPSLVAVLRPAGRAAYRCCTRRRRERSTFRPAAP